MTTNFKFVQAQNFSLSGGGAVSGATSITLKSFAQINGTLLTMADFGLKGYMTLEPGNSTFEEQISFTGISQNANGTATLTGVSTVLMVSPYTETSGLAQTHAGSTTAIVSNTSGFYNNLDSKADDAIITGKYTFPGGGDPNAPVSGTVYATPTADLEYASKKYVDSVAVAGAPDANSTTKGVTRLSVNPVTPTIPIAVGDNDTRVPTAGQAAALAGTSGTPGSGNKYVTNADTSTTASGGALPRGVSGKIATGWIDTGTGANQVVQLDGSSKLPAVDGSALTNIGIFKSGTTSKDTSDASGTQTIAHGLGKTPKWVKITCLSVSDLGATAISIATYNGTTQSNISVFQVNGGMSHSAVFGLNLNNSSNSQSGVVTVNSSNILIAWTKVGSPTGTYDIIWEAQA